MLETTLDKPATKRVPVFPIPNDLPSDTREFCNETISLPTQDDLPCDDGVHKETARHRQQMELLIHSLQPLVKTTW